MVIKKLLEEYESKREIEEETKTGEEDIKIIPAEEVIEEEIKKVGRPRLTEEEKRQREEERFIEKEAREPPRTPYVGGTPDLKDSGGWCLEESKTVTTTVDRRTGTKTIKINGLEVERR
jgi:hypothetical protein